jgi:hypothetical protein
LPLMALSLIALLALEYLVLRKVTRVSQWLGLPSNN